MVGKYSPKNVHPHTHARGSPGAGSEAKVDGKDGRQRWPTIEGLPNRSFEKFLGVCSACVFPGVLQLICNRSLVPACSPSSNSAPGGVPAGVSGGMGKLDRISICAHPK